jgi:hypothetical protein
MAPALPVPDAAEPRAACGYGPATLPRADDYDLPRLAYLPDQLTCTFCHSTPQNLVPIFRDPDDVVFEVKSRMSRVPVFSHSPIFKDLS